MTKLRILCVASLLLASPSFAAIHETKAQKNSAVQEKPRVVDTASVKHSTTRNISLTWCDLHVCEEKPHYIGKASYYGKGYWQGRKMANGEPFDYHKLTAACWFLPLGSRARIVNLENGKSVVVTITDRGPAHNLRRAIDLSQSAAETLDFVGKGTAKVLIQPITQVDTAMVEVPEFLEESQIGMDNSSMASIM
jgi:rare lipoprotein A